MTKQVLRKHTFHLVEGDYQRLADLHPDLAVSEVIRTIIRRHIERVESAAPVAELKLDLEL